MNRFIIIKNTTLNGPAPADSPDSYKGRTYDEDGSVLDEGVLKTLSEFVFPHMTTDLGDGTSIILLSEKHKSYGRDTGTNEDDELQWDAWLVMRGYDPADAFGDKERAEMLPQEVL